MQTTSPRLIKLIKATIVFGCFMFMYVTVFEDKTHPTLRKEAYNKIDDGKTISSAEAEVDMNLPTDWSVPMNEDIESKLEKRQRILEEIKQYHDLKIKKAKLSLPSAILIGARKCGTGGIVKFLEHHPLIFLPEKLVETLFFNRDFQFGMEFYKKKFPMLNNKEIAIEKTPSYFDCSDPGIAKRIKENVPGVKLLLIVCDPVARAFSDYTHQKLGKFPQLRRFKSFDNFIKSYLPKINRGMKRPNEYVGKNTCASDYAATIFTSGLYYYHIQEWLKEFDKTEFMIIDGEDYLRDPGSILEEIQDFLGAPKLLWKEDFVQHPETGFFCYRKLTEDFLNNSNAFENKTLVESLQCLPKLKGRSRKGVRTMTNESIAQLREFYAPHNKLFADVIKRTFTWT